MDRRADRPLSWDRRTFLLATGAALATGGDARADDLPADTLKARAAARGLKYGAAVDARALAADPAYAALLARECAVIVPENAGKWLATEPDDGRFTFDELDAIMAFAAANAMEVRLHNLVWSVWNPSWVGWAAWFGRGDAILERHISTVAGRYRGRVAAWDVLNEPSDPRWSQPDGLINTVWKKALGPGYVDRAFHLARAADPTARLFVNDDGFEYDDARSREKRATYLRLLGDAVKRGVPIDGLGLESHLDPERRFAERDYRTFLADVASLGLAIHITELDICDRALPAEIGARDAAIAASAKALLDAALDEKAVGMVLTWGLTTRYSYLNTMEEARRRDGLAPRGLPYDRDLGRTGLWDAIAASFDHAPARPA